MQFVVTACMQSEQKGNRAITVPFATALKINWALLANWQRLMETACKFSKIKKELHAILH